MILKRLIWRNGSAPQIALNQVRTPLPNERRSGPDFLSSERGSVEAGLAIIPTTLFFLMVLQIVLAGSWQVVERTRVHDLIIRSEITGEEVVAGSLDRSRVSVERNNVWGVGEIVRYRVESEIPVFSAISRNKDSKFIVQNYALQID